MDRPSIAPIQSSQDQHDSSDQPHAKRQAQLLTWTNRRTRVTQACDRCRERKRQCDYLLPRCGRCQTVNKDCTFLAVQKTRGRPLGSSNSNTTKGTPNPSPQTTDTSSNSNRSRGGSSETSVNMTLGPRPDINERRDRQGPSSASTTRTTGPAGSLASIRNKSRVNITSASAPAQYNSHLSAPPRDYLLLTPSSSTPALSFLGRSRSFSSMTATAVPGITTMAAAASASTTTAPSSSTTPAAPNACSKEVIDHLLGLFFEHCFHYFNFFDPLAFLSEYDQGISDPCLVDAMCAIAARFSTHPAVLVSPPYLSGEPFAVRVRVALSRQVISEVTMSYLHTALLLSFYEYSSGRSLQGYHFGGMACRMVPELQLHDFHSRMRGDDEDGGQCSEEDDEEHGCRDYNIDAGAQSSPHQVPSLSPEEAWMANQVKSRTFFYLIFIDTVAAVLSGLPPAIDAAQCEVPHLPDGQRDWWKRTDRKRSTNTGTMPAVSTTPKPELAPTLKPMHQNKPTALSSTTFTSANPRLTPGASRISPSNISPAALHSSPKFTHSANLPCHSASPLSPSFPPGPLLHSHFYLTPTPPTPSPLQPVSFYSHPTTTTKTPASRNNDGPLLQSAFSQSILRVLSRPQLLLGRQPLEHFRTLIPVTAAVMKLTNHGCASEADSTMMLTATWSSSPSSSTSLTLSNPHTSIDHIPPLSLSPSTATGTIYSNTSDTINSNSSGERATAISSHHNTNNELPHHHHHYHHSHRHSPPCFRNPKRRRANHIFSSRERKIEFEQADKDLLLWAEQLPEDYRPTNVIATFQQLELSSVNLAVFYYLMVMILHRPILMNAHLAANRSHQGGGGGGSGSGSGNGSVCGSGNGCGCGSGCGSGDGGRRVSMVVTTAAGAAAAMASGDADMASRTQSEEADDEVVDGEDEGEDTMDEIERKNQIEDNNKDNVRKKPKGGGGENEWDKNGYDSDDAEDLQIVERSMQRCIEAAHTVIAIIRIFDDTMTKYQGGHYTFTVYLAGTILIMKLAKTEDSAVESEIREELEVCFRFFSILGPYWKDTDEKAKVLRDLLSIHDNKNKQQGPNNNEEDEDDQDHEEGDDDDDEGDNGSGGGGGVEDDEGDEYSADDDGGAEQSLQDLMIADALLDLSNRPPRQNYERRRAASRSMPSSSRKAEAAASASDSFLPSTLPPPRSPPPLRLSRSGSSLSNCQRPGSKSQLLSPTTATAATTASQSRTEVLQYPPSPSASLQHTTIPSNHFAITNYTINSTITTAATTTTTTTITTTTTSTTTNPTATTPIRFVERISRGQEDGGSVAGGGGGGGRRHTVSTVISTFLKMDKTCILPPPPPPALSLHRHHGHTTNSVGGGVYPECNNLDETTLTLLEKLRLSIEPPF